VDEDEDEILFFYERAGVELQLEFAGKETLSGVVMTGQPLMADPEQRRAYKVTAPWPPDQADATHGRRG
jgi:hypothetical protein